MTKLHPPQAGLRPASELDSVMEFGR